MQPRSAVVRLSSAAVPAAVDAPFLASFARSGAGEVGKWGWLTARRNEEQYGNPHFFNAQEKLFVCFRLLLALAWALSAQAPTPAFDLVITDGHIIDGTGSPWYSGDLGIRDAKVVAITLRWSTCQACRSPILLRSEAAEDSETVGIVGQGLRRSPARASDTARIIRAFLGLRLAKGTAPRLYKKLIAEILVATCFQIPHRHRGPRSRGSSDIPTYRGRYNFHE